MWFACCLFENKRKYRFLIKPTDVESYAGAILKLGNDKSLRETMGSYNQRIVEKFDVEKISSAMIMIYEDILKHNGR